MLEAFGGMGVLPEPPYKWVNGAWEVTTWWERCKLASLDDPGLKALPVLSNFCFLCVNRINSAFHLNPSVLFFLRELAPPRLTTWEDFRGAFLRALHSGDGRGHRRLLYHPRVV